MDLGDGSIERAQDRGGDGHVAVTFILAALCKERRPVVTCGHDLRELQRPRGADYFQHFKRHAVLLLFIDVIAIKLVDPILLWPMKGLDFDLEFGVQTVLDHLCALDLPPTVSWDLHGPLPPKSEVSMRVDGVSMAYRANNYRVTLGKSVHAAQLMAFQCQLDFVVIGADGVANFIGVP